MDPGRSHQTSMGAVRRQLRSAARAALVAVVVIWALALGFYSGLNSWVPVYIAAALTFAGLVTAYFVKRNLNRSEEIGALIGDAADASAEERSRRLDKIEIRVQKGDAAASLAKAQLQLQDGPEAALKTLVAVDLTKAPKVIGNQVRAMRAMIHLNQGDIREARDLADAIDFKKAPDLRTRANLAGIVAEAWARSGNPIEASELLENFDLQDEQFSEVRPQLLRARTFAFAHQTRLPEMKSTLRELRGISPQLLGIFVSPKRIHPLLSKEARKQLEQSGLGPKHKISGRASR
jgi:hypothetical protein